MAIRSQKTQILHGVGSGTPVFTAIEEVTDVKLGGVTIPQIDVTHLMSTSKEFLSGLKDNGTIDITCNFTNGTVQQAVRGDADLGTISPYEIVLGGAATPITIAFSAFVTKLDGPSAKVDSKLEMQIALKITGNITITVGP
jgi:hypothetical protein